MKVNLLCIIFLIGLSTNLQAQSSEDSLLLHLTFDNSFEDASGNKHVATNHGTTFVEDRNGNPNSAVFFDGIDDFIDIAHKSTLNFGYRDFTISFWLKHPPQVGGKSPNAPGRIFDYATVFIKTPNPVWPYEGITFFVDKEGSGNLNFRTTAIRELLVRTNFNDNTWHFYVLQRKGNTLSIYVDGKLMKSMANPADNTSNSAGIRLGANHTDTLSQNLEGILDELKIYTRAIPQDEMILPELEIFGQQFICTGDKVILSASAGFDAYLWNTNETTRSIEISEGGSYWVRATKESTSSEESIIVNERSCHLFISEAIFCYPDSGILEGPVGYDSYLWNTGDTTNNIKIFEEGWYTLEMNYDTYYIKDSLFIDYRLCFDGKIPNVITPNEDIHNEFFVLPESLSGARVSIFNRWGKRIFESPSYSNNWNAPTHPSGTYYYIVELKEFDFTYKGWLHVFK